MLFTSLVKCIFITLSSSLRLSDEDVLLHGSFPRWLPCPIKTRQLAGPEPRGQTDTQHQGGVGHVGTNINRTDEAECEESKEDGDIKKRPGHRMSEEEMKI